MPSQPRTWASLIRSSRRQAHLNICFIDGDESKGRLSCSQPGSALPWWLTHAGLFAWEYALRDKGADIGVAFPLSYRAPDNDTRSARFLFSVSNAIKLCPERGRGACL